MSTHNIWLLTGSQHLYGEDTLRQVAQHSVEVAGTLSAACPVAVNFKEVLTSPEQITATIREANSTEECVGIIIWMHTFSPAKMWINGLRILQKPLLHLHTQFNRDIPWQTIDMDFMNLNQSAHGDREMGHILSRMQTKRKTVVGHFKDPMIASAISSWCRAALGWNDWQGAKFVRFGDNMRNVAVTEGDKVAAQIKFGFSVNTYGVGDLCEEIGGVSDERISRLCEEYADSYHLDSNLIKGGERHSSLREAARIEAGLHQFLDKGNYKGFTTNFEDLHGLTQLPGIAVQRLMAEGYGFAAEGDWKTAAVVRMMKTMAAGLEGGNSFMEDYTYHFEPGSEKVMGAHMLEICPSIASDKPRCAVYPLSIGGKADPVRLIFDGKAGPAINVSLVDKGCDFQLIVNEVEAEEPQQKMPELPVARVLWKPKPNMFDGCRLWLEAGGAHHTCFSQSVDTEMIKDLATIAGVDLIHIH
jgi:L-arabinose isomerase